MHSYCKTDDGKWQAGYQTDEPRFYPLGPKFVDECWAAAFASFLNGGRFSPGEIEPIFGTDRSPEEDDDEPEDHTTPPSKSRFPDYPLEATQRHK
jgi:hypothetical protein